MAFDNMFYDGKAKAGAAHCAAATGIDAIKSLGQAGQVLGRNAFAFVGNGEPDIRAISFDADFDGRIGPSIFNRIANQIVDNL